MPTYQYKAKDAAGRTVTGSLEADSEHTTADELRSKGLWPMAIEPTTRRTTSVSLPPSAAAPATQGKAPARTVSPASEAPWSAPAVGLKDLAVYFRQLAAAVHSGMPLGRSLEVMRQQSRGTLSRVSAEAAEAAHRGQMLSSVLGRHPRAFSALVVATVRAGEIGGTLDTSLNRIADTLERQYALHQQIKRDTILPKLTLGFGALIVIATRLIIGFIGSGSSVGRGFGGVLVPVLGCAVLAYLAITVLGRLGIRSRAVDQLKLSLPLVGKVVRQLAVARFVRALASLYRAGVAVPEALAVAAEASANSVIADRLLVALPAVQRGERLSIALAPARVLPEMAIHMLSTGEESGNVDEMLDKAADFVEAETETSIKSMAAAVGPVAVILIGILVAIEVLRFYAGYFSGAIGIMSGEM